MKFDREKHGLKAAVTFSRGTLHVAGGHDLAETEIAGVSDDTAELLRDQGALVFTDGIGGVQVDPAPVEEAKPAAAPKSVRARTKRAAPAKAPASAKAGEAGGPAE